MTLVSALAIFAIAGLAGWYAVRAVQPAAFRPLALVVTALSSIVTVGALIVGAEAMDGNAKRAGVIAVLLTSIVIVGGFACAKHMSASREDDI